jgi:hypothetical protein
MEPTFREWTAITKLVLNTNLKDLILSCIDEPEFSRRFPTKTDYAYYWSKLIKYMKEQYDSIPSKPDKFIFLLLLTYPRGYIIRLQSFLDLKIAFNEIVVDGNIIGSSENSDFTCIGYYSADSNCICSQPIGNVYEFQNNISGIVFNVGSVCNNRHGVVGEDDEDYKLMQRAERDRRNDIKNHWPLGTTEQNRLERLQKRKQNKKQNKKYQNKSNSDDDTYITSSICYICKNQNPFSQSSKGVKGICSCVPAKIKTKNKRVFKQLLNIVEMIECINCKHETKKINNDNLCLICKDTHKLIPCQRCLNNFPLLQESNDKVCRLCKPKVKQCIDCFIIITAADPRKLRCYDCYKIKKQNEKYIELSCETCGDVFTVLDEHKERTKCLPCYKKDTINCQVCEAPVRIKTVKKEGPNKGKQFYNCDNCNTFKWQII